MNIRIKLLRFNLFQGFNCTSGTLFSWKRLSCLRLHFSCPICPAFVLLNSNSVSKTTCSNSPYEAMLTYASMRNITMLTRDGFRERGALGHLGFWGPTQVWSIWPFVWKAWKYAPLICSVPWKIYLLWCRLWFYKFLRSGVCNPWPGNWSFVARGKVPILKQALSFLWVLSIFHGWPASCPIRRDRHMQLWPVGQSG